MSETIDAQMEALRKQLHDLEQRKADLAMEEARKKAEEERKRELEKPVKLDVVFADSMMFEIKGTYRPDVIDLYKTVKGRIYDGYGGNRFPTASAYELFKKLRNLPAVEIGYASGVREFLIKYFEAPLYRTVLQGKFVQVYVSPRANAYNIAKLPGARYQKDKDYYEVPLSEAWRMLEDEKLDAMVWSDEAKKFAVEQYEKRQKLNEAATSESSIVVDFKNGIVPRPFQATGISFAIAADGRCIIADQMGLGKSLQYIGYVLSQGFKCNVIVCAAGLRLNWYGEILKLTGDRAYLVTGMTPSNYDIAHLVAERPKWIIVSYNGLASNVTVTDETKDQEGYIHEKHTEIWPWVQIFDLVKPDSMCIDEAHKVKNSQAARTKAVMKMKKVPHIIELTGTPILNRPGEMWTLLHLLYPELFPSEDQFVRQYTYDGKRAKNAEELRSVLQPIMIRRLKRDVMAELPPINRIYESYELSDDARKGYQKVLNGIYEEMAAWGADEKSENAKEVTSILAQIIRLKQICALDKIDFTVELAQEKFEADEGENNRKIIIFSQFVEVVNRIAAGLGSRARFFTGATPQADRMKIVSEFQEDPNVDYLVVTTQVASEGLTLTRGGTTIFNDFMWTPAAHEQAEGRAYGRLNDAHSIDSYYVRAVGTIEDWIVELLAQKLSTINEVIEGVEVDRRASMAMDIVSRLRAEMGR